MTTYDNEIVTRSAPRWAWDIIDETLAMDERSKAFDQETREDIGTATTAMMLACERVDDEPISRLDALEAMSSRFDAWEG